MCFLPLTAGGNWQSTHEGGGFLHRLAVGFRRVGCSLVLGAAKPRLSLFDGPIQKCSRMWGMIDGIMYSSRIWMPAHSCDLILLHQTSRRSRWTVQRQASLSPRPYLSRPPLLINCWRQQLPNRGGRMWYHRSFISNVAHCYKMLKLWVEDQSLLWGKCDWNEKKQQLEDGFVVTLASTCA